MKHISRIVVLLMLMIFIMTPYGYAITIDDYGIENYNDNIFVISGTKGNEKNNVVTIQMLRPSAEINNAYNDGASIKSDFILFTQVFTNDTGKYSVKVKMYESDGTTKVAAGDYLIRVDGGTENGGSEVIYTYAPVEWKANFVQTKIIDPCKQNDKETAKLKLAGADSLGGISGEMTNVVKQLGITDSLVFQIEAPDKLFGILYNLINPAVIDSSDGDKVSQILGFISDAAKIEALNEGKLSVLDKQGEKYIFKLDEKYIKIYDEKLSSSEKAAFESLHFVGKDYDSYKKIGEKFKNELLLYMSKNFQSWGDARDFIVDFGVDSGIDMISYEKLSSTKKSTLYSYVSELETVDFESFKNLVNEKIIELTNENKTSPEISFGGGGGGGSGGAAGSISTPPIASIDPETLKNEDLDKENTNITSFGDLAGFDWAVVAINELAEKQIINGTQEGVFEPSRNVLREEMIKMLLLAFNIEIKAGENSFNDIKADGWYKDYIITAKERGFVKGNSDGSFGVGVDVTREDVAVMAYNVAKSSGADFSSNTKEQFSDDEIISDYAKDAVYTLKNLGVLSGKGTNNFDPKASCTRAEAAKIIYSLLNNLKI